VQLVREVNPDTLLMIETNAWWAEQLRPLEDAYAYVVKQPQDNHYGMILYSRLELVNPEVKFLVSPDIPSIRTQIALPSGQLIWLHGLHPRPPSPSGAEKSTKRDAELLIVGKAVKQQNEPTIVAGDLNDVAWSYTTTLFQKTSGLLDPRIGRGMYNSYNARCVLTRWPLDHVFHSDHFLLHNLRRLPAFGSDHFPIYIDLQLMPQAQALQDEPQLEPHEKEQVEEKIDRVE
jgi:endonuclease/exonuclease/phosphatase (EEP) superfamily protein YafD